MKITRLAFIACVLGACSFEPAAEGGSVEANRCSVDAECVGGSCVDGMCTAQEIAKTLQVAFEVAVPQSTESGFNTFFIERFEIDGPSALKTWQLPAPQRVHGRVRQGDNLVEARVSFVPMTGLAGREPNAASTLTASSGSVPGDMDYELTVTSTGEHLMIVRPTDAGLPPVRLVRDLSESAEQSIDYAELDLPQQTFLVDGIPEERVIMLRAVDRTTGEALSSDGRVVDGKTVLTFGGAIGDYRLIATAEDSYDREPTSSTECANSTPVVPVFSIDSADITDEPPSGGPIELTLPEVPARIVYRGAINLCPAGETELPEERITMPVTLRSSAIDLAPENSKWRAELSTDVEATQSDDDARRFEFCVDAPPGDYSLVVTPPAMLPCELFAEQRLFGSPDGEGGTASVDLVDSPVVTGSVDFAGNPVASAVIEARSLGRENAVQLDDEAASLTAYNRSRQTTTDDQGEFSLLLDIGTYDITVRPPASSGYAWAVLRDATFGRGRKSLPVPITMTPPLPLDCKIGFESGANIAIAGAEIAAYAEIETEGGLRSIPIGEAVADEEGRFTLLLPAEIQDRP